MKVELVAKTAGVGKYSDFTDEQLVVVIARHHRVKPGEEKLINHFMKEGHWSPLDMINYVFEIHTSRAISRQILRHKSINFQEISQRYEQMSNVEPIELRKQHEKNRQSSTEVFFPYINSVPALVQVERVIHEVNSLYKELLNAGVARECARMILPECTTSILTANGTLRSWLSFLNVRMEKHAQKEIQLIAEQIGEELEKHMPTVFKNIDWRNGLFM